MHAGQLHRKGRIKDEFYFPFSLFPPFGLFWRPGYILRFPYRSAVRFFFSPEASQHPAFFKAGPVDPYISPIRPPLEFGSSGANNNKFVYPI